MDRPGPDAAPAQRRERRHGDRLSNLYAEQLGDIRAAEARAMELFPDMAVVASDEELASLFRAAAAESEIQHARLDRLIAAVDKPTEDAFAMDGYLAEAAAVLNGSYETGGDGIDGVLLDSARRSLRYQIAGYESACATARRLGNFRALDVLLRGLDEELATDAAMSRMLTLLARTARTV